MKKFMYRRIIYILFNRVKFQHNNNVKYNSLYSVCVTISQEFFLPDLLFNISLLFYIYTGKDSCLNDA